jgi:hypothetical protein
MAGRKPFLIRVDRDVLDAVQRWADDDLRSLNAQIEFVLRRALQAEGRLRPAGPPPDDPGVEPADD